jgi:Ca-activated chloride channel family protein
MKRWLLFAVLFACLGTVLPARAAGLIIVVEPDLPGIPPRPILPPHPIPPWPPRPEPHVFAPLEVNHQKVQARITDQVAVTSVDEEFYNPNPRRLEGTFIFPIPKGAQLDKFTMEIDGKQAQAELLPAEKARGIYEDIVRRLKDPALMEYEGRDVLKVRIFPIEPNSKKRITLSYTQVLKSDSGLINYVLPLSGGKYSAKPIKTVSVKVDVETKRPLKSIYSPSHAVEVRRDGPNKATAGYEASDVQPDTDFQIYFAPEKDEIGVNLMTYKPADEDGFFMLLAAPGIDVKQRVVAKDVVFVLDTSGSMAGNKLTQAKKALGFCVENLNEDDRFELIRFSTEVEPLFNHLVTASGENRAKATGFIKDLKPIGGTAIDNALREALKLESGKEGRPVVVIFLTDGMPTIGTTDEDQIVAGVKERGKGNRRIFCFGIGTDVNTHLLDKIAEETRAFSTYVLPEEDIEVKVSSFFSKIKEPVLANPTLNFTADVRTSKMYPSPLPDLFKGEQLILVGRYSGKGSSAAIIEGTVNGEPKKLTYDVNFPAESSEHDFIPRLWATRRVGYLLDEIRLHGENSELRDEVTDLARKYGIVTPYTAYLIVEDEAKRGVPLAAQNLPQLGTDKLARDEAQQNYLRFKDQRNGDAAVFGARSGQALGSATVASKAIQSGAGEANRAWGLPDAAFSNPASPALSPNEQSAARVMGYTQQTQFAGGRNFFQNGNQWIDSGVQKQSNAKRVRVQFGSPEYFVLLKKHPETAQWFALGANVQFVLGDSVYEIFDATEKPGTS